MNVFWLDDDFDRAAEYHCDQHITKMPLESAQILSTALRQTGHDWDFLYRSTHTGHPVVKWAAESKENFETLLRFAKALGREFERRRGKTHKSIETVVKAIDMAEVDMVESGRTDRPLCMPDKYKVHGDPVKCYRHYYAGDKSRFATWTDVPTPEWYTDLLEEYQ